MSYRVRQFLILVLFCLCTEYLFSNNDSLGTHKKSYYRGIEASKKNFLYVLPMAVGGDLFWELDNFWLEIGYDRISTKKTNHLLGLKIGAIVYSQPSYENLLSSLSQRYTNGFNINAEHKIVLKRFFYYSTNIFYQWTKTIRDEKYNSKNSYSVYRNVVCLYPKIGFLFINKKSNISTDIGLGIGIRYIGSYNADKINTEINSGYETFADKEFDRGSKFAQKIYFQYKIGYNF